MPARILVVDDSPTILKVVSSILAHNGYEVETARDGVLGLEQIGRRGPFDLVLLDFVMPRMNGYQFCREVRQNPAYKSLGVVLMSAKGDRIRDQFVQQTGALDAITKPFEPLGLIAVIEGALGRVKAGRAPIVPEGETMPEDSSFGDEESRSSVLPLKLQRKATTELAKHVSSVVAPALLELPAAERSDPEALARVVSRAFSQSSLDRVLHALRETLSGVTREVLSGDLALVPLAEVLQLLQMQRQSGLMRVVSGQRSLVLFLREGLIDFAQASEDNSEFRLGRYFVEMGLMSRADIEAAVESARRSGQRLGDAVVAAGQVTDAHRREALVRQSSELVYDLVRWKHGRFWLAREPLPHEAEEAKLGLGVAGLVLEGFRRVDEWRLMEGTIVWDQIVAVDEAAHKQVTEKLTHAEQMLLRAADGKRTITQLVHESELGRFDALKIVYQFLSSRVLRPIS